MVSIYYCINTQHSHTKNGHLSSRKRSTKRLKEIGHILIKTSTIQKLFKLQTPTEKISTKHQRKCKHPPKKLYTTTPTPLSTYQVFISPHTNRKDYVRRSKDYAHGSYSSTTGRQ